MPPVPGVPEAKKSFFSTTAGKVVAIGGAVVALLTILGMVGTAVFVFVIGNRMEDALRETIERVQETPPASQVVTGTTDGEASEPKTVPYTEVFTFRDIFEPLLEADPEPSDTTTGSATGGSTSTTTTSEPSGREPGVLYLDEILDDADPQAVFTLDSQTYTAGEGQRLGTTPWQVLSIEGDTVVMLYGDDRVSLTVGEGASK